ncbi:hypothetical protein SDD30_14695 [Moorella naiadis]|uniref:hypothetical protein n=1 Tax=Moorella naiadis (nom. illeg.) TaxID=3093670 RepID=UPI003D9CB523
MKTLFLVAILAVVWFLSIIGVLGGKISYYWHYRRERQQAFLPTGNVEPAEGNSSTNLSTAVAPGAAGAGVDAGVDKVAGNIFPGTFGVQPRSDSDTSGNPRASGQ